MRAGQLAGMRGVNDIRADHLIRGMAESGISDLHSVLRKVGLRPRWSGGAEAARAAEEIERLGREHSDAVSGWLLGRDVP
jgi:hypothetical protein